MADVFVSYCRRDRPRVAPLVQAISARGWSVWWDREIAPGQEFDRLIDAELARARAVLVVWTPESVASRWVRGEARDAADRGILVPVRYDAATLPIDVRVLHTIDLDGDGVGGSRIEDMLEALAGLLAGGPMREATTAPAQPRAPGASPSRVDICVLPFANPGGDPEQQYFSDGITEDIITELSRWRSLAVRSRAASFRYRAAVVDLRQVARELGVRFVVTGSVRRMGGRVRISVQVADAGTGSQVWAEKFDRASSELFDVQDEVVRTIVSTLVGRVRDSDVERTRRKPPSSLAAYELVLQGNALSWDDPAAWEKAKGLFERAVALDPQYGLAHALLANMRAEQWREDDGGSDALLEEAHALAQRAVELDAGESTCFSLLAQVCLLERAWEPARRYMQRAIELNPGNQWNVADMGFVLVHLGESAHALEWFQRARDIDPYFDPPWYWRTQGMALLFLHREAEALGTLAHLQAPSFRSALLRAACLARLGEEDAARAQARQCLALEPGFSIARFLRRLPLRSDADAATLVDGLQRAGLPE